MAPEGTTDAYIKARDEAIALVTDLHKSSAQEYDKQMVYIAGGGLGLTLTFAKDIVTLTGSHFILLLILTWIAFAVALLCNLISHRKATEVYSLTRRLHLYLRDCARPNATYDKAHRQALDATIQQANRWLTGLNRASEWAVMVGIGTFIAFSALSAYQAATRPATPAAARSAAVPVPSAAVSPVPGATGPAAPAPSVVSSSPN